MSQHKNKQTRRHGKKKNTTPMLLLLGGGLLLVIGAMFTLLKPSQPKAAIEVNGTPGMRVDKETVDLGDVKLGKTVTVSFQITNVGDQTLRFTKAPYIEVLEGC